MIWDLLHSVDRAQTMVTHDSGNPRDQIAALLGGADAARLPRLGQVDPARLPAYGSRMGAKLGRARTSSVINVMGDLAFGMAGMEVETAVRERIPILTVLLNNSRDGRLRQVSPDGERAVRLQDPLWRLRHRAEGLGAYSERVEAPGRNQARHRPRPIAIADGRPALLEMITREEPEFEKHW